MWKVVVFVEEIHAACNAFSEIYIYFIWKYEVLSKKNMLLDISVYFQSFMEWVYHIQLLRTNCVKRRKFLYSKGNFLDFHVVKLYASGCSVISHWIGSTVISFCVLVNPVKKMKDFLCCSRNFPDVNVVKLYAQGCSVIWHWIYHLQTWYVAGIALYVFMQKCVLKSKRNKFPYLWFPEKKRL